MDDLIAKGVFILATIGGFVVMVKILRDLVKEKFQVLLPKYYKSD